MNIKTLCQTLLFSILSIFAVSSSANGLFGEIGLHLGGDKLATATFVGGDTESIRAGELLSISGGVVTDVNEQVEARISVGYKIDFISAENGDLDFTRIPLELLFFKKNEKWSVGGGITYHLGPELSGSGFAAGNVEFDDALGFVLEADHMLRTGAYIGIKLTLIEYEVNDPFFVSETFDANSVGIVLGLKF